MVRTRLLAGIAFFAAAILLWGCSSSAPAADPTSPTSPATALAQTAASATPAPQHPSGKAPSNAQAIESFVADIAQNVAGDRFKIPSLIPLGTDPHAFEPTPADVASVANSDLLIVHGAGLEGFLEPLLKNAGGQRAVIEVAAGIPSRKPNEGEAAERQHQDDPQHPEGDPHFWLDPNNVVKYVENLREGLSRADPEGAPVYAANAQAYSARLKELDGWIVEQLKLLPQERRLLVTNHESFGYFADRYGFKLVGTIVPSVGAGASPSAQQMAHLVDEIRRTGAKAIFLETGTNPQLAERIAREAGIKVVTQLYTHSLTPPGGDAPSYIEMMRFNTRTIVEALR